VTASPAFTPKTLSFLRSLKRNNDRAWFHARRDDYERHVRAPMIAVVEQLAIDFKTLAPELVADPKASLFRPWRDTRFSEDKRPLKTNVAAVFPHRSLGRQQGAGLYFEVATTWVWIGGGVYSPDRTQLLAIRQHLTANHARMHRLVNAAPFQAIGGLKGDKLTRAPRGFPPDHAAAEYLVCKQWLGAREEPAAFATRPDFYAQLLDTMTAMLPLVRFLNEPLLERRARRGPDLTAGLV
jgi:uncharacterized protein (TIGR02453 family)